MSAYFKNIVLHCFLLCVSCFAFHSCDVRKHSDPSASDKGTKSPVEENNFLIVSNVIDGDTFKMSNGEKVRLIGIDTPEKFESDKLNRESLKSGRDKQTIQKLGEESSEYVRILVEGKKVKLVTEKGYTDRDKYGRLLRYVYLEDGTLVNAKIIEDGYANVFNAAGISKLEEFRKLEQDARTNKRGLWGEVEGLK